MLSAASYSPISSVTSRSRFRKSLTLPRRILLLALIPVLPWRAFTSKQSVFTTGFSLCTNVTRQKAHQLHSFLFTSCIPFVNPKHNLHVSLKTPHKYPSKCPIAPTAPPQSSVSAALTATTSAPPPQYPSTATRNAKKRTGKSTRVTAAWPSTSTASRISTSVSTSGTTVPRKSSTLGMKWARLTMSFRLS